MYYAAWKPRNCSSPNVNRKITAFIDMSFCLSINQRNALGLDVARKGKNRSNEL